MSHDERVAGLAIHWKMFDSNDQEKADYSRGVLERFTRCSKGISLVVKSIANPRKIACFTRKGVHNMAYFTNCFCVDENLGLVKSFKPTPATAKIIVINHYQCKSLEEYLIKIKRGDAVFPDKIIRTLDVFKKQQLSKNFTFDDGILKYRNERAKVYHPPDNSHVDERLLSALERNLSPTLSTDTPIEFYEGKIETFLTCRAVASYLQTKLSDTAQVKLYEEAALKAILKSLQTRYTFADAGLLVQELPTLLKLPYPVVEELRKV